MSTRCSGTEICSIVFGGEYCLLHNDPGLKYAELATSTSSVIAVASMVRQKTVRLHCLVDRHTIDRHEQTYRYLSFGSRVLDLKLYPSNGGELLTTSWPPGVNAFHRRGYRRELRP